MVRRTNRELRLSILELLKKLNQHTVSIRQISEKTGIDWYTVERHLNYLKGRDLVREVFRHRMLRLFQISDLGKDVMQSMEQKRKSKKITLEREKERIISIIRKNI